jgi:hypothetical protein
MIDNLETRLHHNFRVMRLLDERLQISDCQITCELSIAAGTAPKEIHRYLNGMKCWLDNFVNGCIVCHADPDMDITWTRALDNNIMLSPGNPHDHLMLILLHAKLTAIGAPVIGVKRTEFMSDTGHGFACALTGDTDEWLPDVAEWVGQHRYFELPWWARNDASTMDLFATEDSDLGSPPDFGGPMSDMFLDEDELQDRNPQEAEIIKPAFKFKLVDDID